MNKSIILLLFLLLVLATGCYSKIYMNKSFEVGQEIESNTGNPMISFEYFSGSSGFRQELVYSGINNQIISLLYREYTVNQLGTFIKDGYSISTTYDLNISSDKTFRGTKFNIVSADNNSIRFVVLSSQAGEFE